MITYTYLSIHPYVCMNPYLRKEFLKFQRENTQKMWCRNMIHANVRLHILIHTSICMYESITAKRVSKIWERTHTENVLYASEAEDSPLKICDFGLSCKLDAVPLQGRQRLWRCVAVCCSVLQCVQCVAVCCSVFGVLHWVAVCCNVLQWVAVCCSVFGVLQCAVWKITIVEVHISVLQCVAVCCSVCCSVLYSLLQCVRCVAVCCSALLLGCSMLQCVAVCSSVLCGRWWFWWCASLCCSVLQCVAVCCSVLQCVAVCCSVLCGRKWSWRCIHVWSDEYEFALCVHVCVWVCELVRAWYLCMYV